MEYELRISNSDTYLLSGPIQGTHSLPLLSVKLWQPGPTLPGSQPLAPVCMAPGGAQDGGGQVESVSL